MCKYTIPQSVNILFDYKKEIPQLQHRIYRILWVSISIGHIRDQYFKKNVATATRLIKKRNPQSFKDFLDIIYDTELCKFGKDYYGRRTRRGHGWLEGIATPLYKPWWRQIWNLIKYNGDIELVQMIPT